MKKIGLLSLALVLALGTLGIGYATWSDNVTVEEQVFSGKLCAQWSNTCDLSDEEGEADQNMEEDGDLCAGEDPIDAPEDKDIGSANCTREDSDGDGYYDTLVVTVNNTYPSYYLKVDADLLNCGTIPWKIQKVELLNGNDQLLQTLTGIGCYQVDLGGTADPDLEIAYGNNFGVQIEPCPPPTGKYCKADLSWEMHLLQTAPEGATLVFKFKVYVVQWNMYVAP